MSLRLDDEELELLAGHGASRLSHAAKVAYMLGIRPYMDYATGLVGYRRRVSYQSLRELLEVTAVPGSHRNDEQPKKDEIRSLLRELERAGLIRWIKSPDRGLFFECLAAYRGIPSKNRSHPGATPSRHPMSNPMKSRNGEGFVEIDEPNEPPLSHPKEPPTSGNKINTPPPMRVGARETAVDNSVAGMPACIPEAEWRVYEQERHLATGRPMSIGRQLALWQELAALDAEGYDLGKVLRRCVAHGFATFDRRPELMKKPPGVRTSTTQRGHYADVRDVDNSAVGKTRRACALWESQFDARSGDDESGGDFEGEFDPPTLQ